MPSGKQGLRLEFSDARAPVTDLADVNHVLSEIGAGVFPLGLSEVPVDVRQLLTQRTLTETEVDRVKAQFLLSRERLVEIISATGRPPNTPGGGELKTFDATHGYYYPQLWVAQDDVDYSRFDRLHRNTADDGVGVNEVGQLLAGRNFFVQHRMPDGQVVTVTLDCPGNDHGWIVTYDGGNPHIGSFSKAEPGTKVLVQVIGPARWSMRYEQ